MDHSVAFAVRQQSGLDSPSGGHVPGEAAQAAGAASGRGSRGASLALATGGRVILTRTGAAEPGVWGRLCSYTYRCFPGL